MGDFYFAYEKNRPVVGAFVINFGNTRIYKDGGSTPDTLYKSDIAWPYSGRRSKMPKQRATLCMTSAASRQKKSSITQSIHIMAWTI